MINKFQKGGKQQDAVMQFVKGLADTLQADPNEVIQLAQKHPDALESAVQVYQQTEGDMKKAAQAFAQTIQKKTKKALHGAKLQYFKNLKNQCADDEELYYYKKGGSLGCGCKKKEIGGEVRKAGLGCSAVDKFKLTRKAQSGIKNYTKDQIAGREPVKVVNGVKYYLNGDGEIVKDPKGKNSAKPDDGSWQTYDEKTGKMRPATPAEIAQRKKNNRDGYKGKGEGTPQRKKGGNLKKDCGGSTVIAKFKAKCGAKVKKHEQGGNLNRIPFYQAGGQQIVRYDPMIHGISRTKSKQQLIDEWRARQRNSETNGQMLARKAGELVGNITAPVRVPVKAAYNWITSSRGTNNKNQEAINNRNRTSLDLGQRFFGLKNGGNLNK